MSAPWFGSKEACEYLGGIHINTLMRYVGEGMLVPARIGRTYRFTYEMLDRFMETTRRKS